MPYIFTANMKIRDTSSPTRGIRSLTVNSERNFGETWRKVTNKSIRVAARYTGSMVCSPLMALFTAIRWNTETD